MPATMLKNKVMYSQFIRRPRHVKRMKKELFDIGTWNVNTMLEDDVLEDIKSMNVHNWKNEAQNRDRWKKVVKQARTLTLYRRSADRFI